MTLRELDGMREGATSQAERDIVEIRPDGVRACRSSRRHLGAESVAALQGLLGQLAEMRLTGHSPSLADVTATITFLASDKAAGLTATWVNATQMFIG